MGNPGVNLLVPGALLTDVRPMGEEGKHVRFTVEAGGGALPRRRVRLRRPPARQAPARPPTRPSASSATAGTAPSSRACGCATRRRARPSR